MPRLYANVTLCVINLAKSRLDTSAPQTVQMHLERILMRSASLPCRAGWRRLRNPDVRELLRTARKAIFNSARSRFDLLGQEPSFGVRHARIRGHEQRRLYGDYRRHRLRQDDTFTLSPAQSRQPYHRRPNFKHPARQGRAHAVGDDVAKSTLRR